MVFLVFFGSLISNFESKIQNGNLIWRLKAFFNVYWPYYTFHFEFSNFNFSFEINDPKNKGTTIFSYFNYTVWFLQFLFATLNVGSLNLDSKPGYPKIFVEFLSVEIVQASKELIETLNRLFFRIMMS